MQKVLCGLLLTLIAGLFFLIGGFISLKVKDKNKLNYFSNSLAFIIIINLLLFDLVPEVLENLEEYNIVFKIIISSIFISLGICSLKILDRFIPDHHHEHCEINDNIKEHTSHLSHIGLLTLISLVLHNILEGFAIYSLSVGNIKMGILASLSVALHNIPLGTQIFSSIDLKKNIGLITILTTSSLIGGIIYLIIGNVSNLVLAIIFLITIGMLLYLGLFELLGEVRSNLSNKYTKIGLIVGIIIIILSVVVK